MKEIVGYEGLYQVSAEGHVYSPAKGTSNPRGKFMTLSLDHSRYTKVGLCKNGKKYNHSVHRLVAEAWIPNPNNLPQVNHKNGNREDNRVENLEWCSLSENIKHSFRELGRKVVRGAEHANSRLRDVDVEVIKESLSKGVLQRELAQRFNVTQATISNIKNGKRYLHI